MKGKTDTTQTKKIKVLVGDYLQQMAVLTNSALKSMGIETEFVRSGEEIIDKINKGENFNLIISNSCYPRGIGGTTVVKQLKLNKDFSIPVIVLTVDESGRKEFIADGFDEYILKPLETEKIINIIPKVIDGLKFNPIETKKKV